MTLRFCFVFRVLDLFYQYTIDALLLSSYFALAKQACHNILIKMIVPKVASNVFLNHHASDGRKNDAVIGNSISITLPQAGHSTSMDVSIPGVWLSKNDLIAAASLE